MNPIGRSVWRLFALAACVLSLVAALLWRVSTPSPPGAGPSEETHAPQRDLTTRLPAPLDAARARLRDPHRDQDRDQRTETSGDRVVAHHEAEAAATERPDAESLDDAPWPTVERRLTAAVRYAREAKGAIVPDELLPRLREQGTVHVSVRLTDRYHSIDPLLAGAVHEAPYYYDNLPFARVEVGAEALENLLHSGWTGDLGVRRWLRASLLDTTEIVQADIAIADGADGTGTTIVVIDSGVETSHHFFDGRVVDGHCYSAGLLCPNGQAVQEDDIAAGEPCAFTSDECAHGTMVAGVAMGDAGVRFGVAPDASLISIMAGSENPEESGEIVYANDDVAAAFDKIYSQRNDYDIAAVNLSIATDERFGRTECQNLDPVLRDGVALLRSADIAVIAASGNEGGKSKMSFPACLDGVISVGATTKSDRVWSQSNSASYLHLLAPGTAVTTSTTGDTYAEVRGTSFAAPHVAGAFAALRSVYPTMEADRILLALQIGGELIEDPDNGVTTPRIQIASTINLIETGDLRWDSEKVYDDMFTGSAKCGLIGIELLIPLIVVRGARRRRAEQRPLL